MKKRLIAFLLIAAFTFEQTNVITAFADEKDGYVPLYDAYGNEVNYTDESFTGKDESGNYLPLYKSNGDEMDYQEKLESSNSTSSNSSSSSSTASTYVPLYDAQGNEVNYTDPAFTGYTADGKYIPLYDAQKNEVDYLGRLEDGSDDTTPLETFAPYVPLYDAEGNEVNYKELIEEFYTTRDKAFKYIPLYDAEGNEVDWCGLLENTDEWNANGLYTVTFIDSFDNSVIDTYIVPTDGKIDELPAAPTHDGYTFLDYIGNYLTVNQNEIVTAVYLESTAKLDVFGYIGENTDDFYEFYIYGTRINSDGVLSKDLSQVQLSLNDYTWIDEMGNTFTPDEEGNFVDQRGNVFIPYIESEIPEITIDIPVVMLAEVGNTNTAVGSTNKNSADTSTDVGTANKSTNRAKLTKDATKTSIRYSLNVLIAKNPYLNFAAGPLVGLIEAAFDENTITTNQLSEQIKNMDSHIDKVGEQLKNHSQNIADFTSLASEFDDLQKKSEALKTKIEDLEIELGNGEISQDRYTKELAALYKNPVYTDVYSAFFGATNAFKGKTSYTQKTIFDAAYDKQLGYVMFSGEALDCISPYVLTELEMYTEAYGNMNTVLNAYEKTRGKYAAVATRNKLHEYMVGDGTTPGVYQLCADFYSNHSRYIFVDKSADPVHHKALKSTLTMTTSIASKYCESGWFGGSINFPGELTGYTLSADQVNRLAEYCQAKKISILDYLTDRVGFTLDGECVGVTKQKDGVADVQFGWGGTVDIGAHPYQQKIFLNDQELEKKYHEDTIAAYKKNCYLLTGPQEGEKEGRTHFANTVNANVAGSLNERIDLFVNRDGVKNDINILIFQRE